jgi:hypothetical protein
MADGREREDGSGSGGGDGHLPASESGTGMIPEDQGEADVHLPESEAETAPLQEERESGEPQSWPGKGGPGTFLPPG